MGQLAREHEEHDSNLRLDIAQRVYERKPLWQQYLDGTLEVHLHALRDGRALCIEFAPYHVFRELKHAADAEVYVHGDDFAVLRGVVEVTKASRPVRSLERLKLANDCHVFVREAFEASRTPSREALRRVLYEELRAGLWRTSVMGGKNVDEVIKRDSEVLYDLSDEHTCFEAEGIENRAARSPIPGIRIYLGKYAVSAQRLDAADDAVEIRQVFACPRMSPVRTLQRIHGVTSP